MKTNISDKIAIDLCEQSYLDSRKKIANFLYEEYGAHDVKLHKLKDVGMEFITCRIGASSYLAIRGTKGGQDVITDLDLSSYDMSLKKLLMKKKKGKKWFDLHQREIKRLKKLKKSMGLKHLHFGIFQSAESIYQYLLKKQIQVDNICGHSLGGGVAHMLGMFIDDLHSIITFGASRVGGISFVIKYNKKYKSITKRYFNYMDIVPKVPLRIMFYMHVGNGYFFDKIGKLKKRVEQFRELSNWSRKVALKDVDVKKFINNHFTPIYKRNVLRNMI